jgi:hypothetical protein
VNGISPLQRTYFQGQENFNLQSSSEHPLRNIEKEGNWITQKHFIFYDF